MNSFRRRSRGWPAHLPAVAEAHTQRVAWRLSGIPVTGVRNCPTDTGISTRAYCTHASPKPPVLKQSRSRPFVLLRPRHSIATPCFRCARPSNKRRVSLFPQVAWNSTVHNQSESIDSYSMKHAKFRAVCSSPRSLRHPLPESSTTVRDTMGRKDFALRPCSPFWEATHCVGASLRTCPYGKPSSPEWGDMKSVQYLNDPETSPRQHVLGDHSWKGCIDCHSGSHVRVPSCRSSLEALRFPCPRNRVVPETNSRLR